MSAVAVLAERSFGVPVGGSYPVDALPVLVIHLSLRRSDLVPDEVTSGALDARDAWSMRYGCDGRVAVGTRPFCVNRRVNQGGVDEKVTLAPIRLYDGKSPFAVTDQALGVGIGHLGTGYSNPKREEDGKEKTGLSEHPILRRGNDVCILEGACSSGDPMECVLSAMNDPSGNYRASSA